MATNRLGFRRLPQASAGFRRGRSSTQSHHAESVAAEAGDTLILILALALNLALHLNLPDHRGPWRDNPDWSPVHVVRIGPEKDDSHDSAHKKLHALLDKEPRWLHPRSDSDMGRRVNGLANSPTRLRSSSNATSGDSPPTSDISWILSRPPAPLGMEADPRTFFCTTTHDTATPPDLSVATTTVDSLDTNPGEEEAAEAHHPLSAFLRRTTCLSSSTNQTTGTFHRVLFDYSEPYVQTVKRLVKRFTAPMASPDSSSPCPSFAQGPGALESWFNDEAPSPVFHVRPLPLHLPGDYLSLDELGNMTRCCPSMTDFDSCVLPWLNRDGLTPDGQRILRSGPTRNDAGRGDSFGNTVLHFLAARGSIDGINHSLQLDYCKPCIEAKNSSGQTFLHVLNGRISENADYVCELLAMISETNPRLLASRDCYGRTFFHLVLAGLHPHELFNRLAAFCDQDCFAARDAFGFSPAHAAVPGMDCEQHKTPVLALPSPDGAISTTDSRIMEESRLLETVRLAAQCPSLQDHHGRNGLHCLAKAPLSSATVVNKYHLQPYSRAKVTKRHQAPRDALDSSADKLSLRRDLLTGLLDAGVDANQHDDDGNTPLMAFVAELPEDNDYKIPPQILEALVGKGANVNARNRRGETALHVAVQRGRKLAMRTLVKLGANVHTRDSAGRSLLDVVDAEMVTCRSDEHTAAYAHLEACRAWLSGRGMALQRPTFVDEWGRGSPPYVCYLFDAEKATPSQSLFDQNFCKKVPFACPHTTVTSRKDGTVTMVKRRVAALEKLDADFASLQYKIRRDPRSYRDDFLKQWEQYESQREIFLMSPAAGTADSIESFHNMIDLIAHVADCYPDETRAFPDDLKMILNDHHAVLNHDLRDKIVGSLVLLRRKDVIDSSSLLTTLFPILVSSPSKTLRELIFQKILSDMRNSNSKSINHPLNRTVQTVLYNLVTADRASPRAIWAIKLTRELWKRQIWSDARPVDVMKEACLSDNEKVVIGATRFFLGGDKEREELEDDSSDDDIDLGKIRHQIGINKKTKKQKKSYEKAVNKVRRDERKKSKPHPLNFSALHLLHDPQGFVEQLFAKHLQNTRSKLSLDSKILVLQLVTRLVGLHKLTLVALYSWFIKYLTPRQQSVTTILACLAQGTHNLVPPDALEPLIQKIANEFVSEAAAAEVCAAGVNSIREICARQPLAMTDTLLQDLVQYRKSKDKGVMMAAKGLLSLYREVGAELLQKKDRGKNATISLKSGIQHQQKFGEEAVGGIEGLELLAKWKEDEKKRRRLAKGLAETAGGDEGKPGAGGDDDDDNDNDDDGDDSDGWEVGSEDSSDSGEWINVEHSDDEETPPPKKAKQKQSP
ncbi:hypothetical protein E4U42_004712, partial [Claviceps africana]